MATTTENEMDAASTKKLPLPPTLREENRRLSLLQETQAGTIRSLMDEVTWLSGELREDGDRYRDRIFLLDGVVANLKDQVAELEQERDELQARVDDLDDPPIEEPPRPVDMGSRHGTEVTPRVWGEEAGS